MDLVFLRQIAFRRKDNDWLVSHISGNLLSFLTCVLFLEISSFTTKTVKIINFGIKGIILVKNNGIRYVLINGIRKFFVSGVFKYIVINGIRKVFVGYVFDRINRVVSNQSIGIIKRILDLAGFWKRVIKLFIYTFLYDTDYRISFFLAEINFTGIHIFYEFLIFLFAGISSNNFLLVFQSVFL